MTSFEVTFIFTHLLESERREEPWKDLGDRGSETFPSELGSNCLPQRVILLLCCYG